MRSDIALTLVSIVNLVAVIFRDLGVYKICSFVIALIVLITCVINFFLRD